MKTLKRGKVTAQAVQSITVTSPPPAAMQRDVPIIPSELLPVTLAQFRSEWGCNHGS